MNMSVYTLFMCSASCSSSPLCVARAVGDNPASDVAGARAAGSPWVPVLVTTTGVWSGPGNSAAAPADLVVDDVEAAVAAALQQ